MRAELHKAKKCCQRGKIGCPTLKEIVVSQFAAYFLKSLHQADFENWCKMSVIFFVVFLDTIRILCIETVFCLIFPHFTRRSKHFLLMIEIFWTLSIYFWGNPWGILSGWENLYIFQLSWLRPHDNILIWGNNQLCKWIRI